MNVISTWHLKPLPGVLTVHVLGSVSLTYEMHKISGYSRRQFVTFLVPALHKGTTINDLGRGLEEIRKKLKAILQEKKYNANALTAER